LDLLVHTEWPEERQLHEMSLKSIKYGRLRPRSMFVSSAILVRNTKLITDKVVSDSSLTRAEIVNTLKTIARNINGEIVRNLKRNPKLMKIYRTMVKNGGESVVNEKELK